MRRFVATAPNGATFTTRRLRTQTHAVLVKSQHGYELYGFCANLQAAERHLNANREWAESHGWQILIVEAV
jgi:hypothetical protein